MLELRRTSKFVPVRRSVFRAGLPAIIGAAALQRSGHFGIKSLLIVYLTTAMKMPDHHAGQVYGLFYGSLFLSSLLGGVLGDRNHAYLKVGSFGLLLMLVGQAGLSLGSLWQMVLSLIISSVGFGMFDPNMNALIAQLCNDAQRRDAAYRMLFVGINVGAMLGPLICGYVAIKTKVRFGFIVGALFSLLGLLLFRLMAAPAAILVSDQSTANNHAAIDAPPSSAEERKLQRNLLALAALGLLGIMFWAVYDQLGSSVTLLAERYVHRTFWSFEVPAGYVQAINPFLVILLGPLFSLMIKQTPAGERNESRYGTMLLGLLLLGAGFGLLALGSRGVGAAGVGHTVGWGWIWVAILLATAGELLFVPRSMSLAAALAPHGRRALIFGVWSATAGLGAYLSGTMAGFMNDFSSLAIFFELSMLMCLGTGLLFFIIMSAVEKHRPSVPEELPKSNPKIDLPAGP